LYECEIWSIKLREEHWLRIFENRVLMELVGPKKDEVTWECRSLHNEELCDLYCSPYIIRMIKSRMYWTLFVARLGEREQSACRFRSKHLKGKDHLENQSACGTIILKWIFGMRGMDWSVS